MYTTHNKKKNKERIKRIQKKEGHRKTEAMIGQTIVKRGMCGVSEKGGWQVLQYNLHSEYNPVTMTLNFWLLSNPGLRRLTFI